MQGKRRVYVKASKKSKAYYRMQTVGREEIDSKVSGIWEIPRDKFMGLISGNKLELKEKYIDEHSYKPGDKHPKLEYLVGLMSETMKDLYSPPIFEEFTQEISMHSKAVWQALGKHEHVPLHVLKDYPDAAYSYEIDISDEALEQESSIGEITNLFEMTKGEYDSIIDGVKKDYERDPKKVTDTMLSKYYADELLDVKAAAKLRKKLFDNIPVNLQEGFTPETMNDKLHEQTILSVMDNLNIPDDVKAGYPIYFKGVPFTYEPTGNKHNDEAINEILDKVRDTCGNDLSEIDDVVKEIIGSSGDSVPVHIGIEDHDMEDLVNVAMSDVSKLIGKDLFDKINEFTNNPDNHPIRINYDSNRNRAYGGEEIMLGVGHLNVKNKSYDYGVISHEYGHSIEYMIPEISEAARSFRDRRTEGEKVVKFVDILPNMGYNDWETTQVDHFMTAYMGKNYPNATEILSTGIAFLTTKESTQRMYREDPEYFGLILGMVSGKIGDKDE